MNDLRVSVIVPTYNRARYVVEALESALAQSRPADEILVVDDGSTDETRQVLSPFANRIVYLHQENGGIAAARNAGVARSTGDLVSFLDDDDVWLHDKLRSQVAAFEEDPGLDAVYGHAEQFISPEVAPERRRRLEPLTRRSVPATIASTLLIRRSGFDRVGGFDPGLRIGVDMDWYARAREAGLRTATLDAVVLRRRLHATNTNVLHAHEQSERLHVLKRMLDRRRNPPSG